MIIIENDMISGNIAVYGHNRFMAEMEFWEDGSPIFPVDIWEYERPPKTFFDTVHIPHRLVNTVSLYGRFTRKPTFEHIRAYRRLRRMLWKHYKLPKIRPSEPEHSYGWCQPYKMDFKTF
jgi:hypothetical protein